MPAPVDYERRERYRPRRRPWLKTAGAWRKIAAVAVGIVVLIILLWVFVGQKLLYPDW